MEIFSGTIHSLEKALDYSTAKQNVISQNIANADTPNYKAQEITKNNFQNELNSAMDTYRTDNRHFAFTENEAKPFTISRNNVSYNNNGNSVDVDKEMSDLATNQIYYNAVTDRLAGKFSSLQNVIRGGK
ncbi:flagellar basal body rod protein FlgB [Bacillus massiliglaciei]|uniref:flagellar basal body rod protein FlgB n=1 Tax=Bacillus massiliglaciei TaxID=1816693 RepID=UPI000ABC0764|nr:flagellar basal body rod protein FlgB [Bacillus massiliglaciei]